MKKIRLIDTTYGPASVVAAIGMGFLLLVFPFVFRFGYMDITEVRFRFFAVLSSLVFVGCVLAKLPRMGGGPRLSPASLVKKEPLGAAFLLFFAAMCLSALLSDYREASLTGSEGRYMGLWTYFAIAMMFFWISRCYVLSVRTLAVFNSACSVVAVLAMLQFIDIDLLHLLRGVSLDEMSNFLSVFGNINVYAAYLSTAAPVAMLMSCFAETKKMRLLFLGFSFFGFIGLLTSNSDSSYIAYGAAFFLLFFLIGRSPVRLKRFVRLLLTLFAAMIVFSLAFYAAKGIRGRSGITELLTTPPVPYIGAAFSGLLYWVAARFFSSEKRIGRLRILVLAAACVGAAAVLGIIVYFSVFNTTASIGYPEKFLRFNDAWGTDRGFVWSRLLMIFRDSPLKKKLFGYGQETVAVILLQSYGQEMISKLGYVFDNAHNELLQYLLTTGLLGLLSYLGLLAVAIHTGFRKDSPVLKKALALAVAAYAAQSVFNIIQPISTPYLFMLIGLLGSQCAAPSPAPEETPVFTDISDQNESL